MSETTAIWHTADNPDGTCSDLSCPCHQWGRQDAPLVQLPLEHVPLTSLSAATAKRATVSNRPLVPSRRQLFEGPLSDDVDYCSLPLLLRAVADWMEDNDVEDPEFDELQVNRTFPNTDSDECRYEVTLFYRLESDK